MICFLLFIDNVVECLCFLFQVEEPKYSAVDMGSLIPTDTRVQFDVRTVLARLLDGSRFDEFKVG
jgi:acetyl-CoA carboxylase carboxyltransferase component